MSCWRFAFAVLALCSSAGIAAQTTSLATSSVAIAGNVSQPLSLTVADLKRYPAYEIAYQRGGAAERKAGNEPPRRYTGCLLRDILAAAKPIESKPRELRRSYVVASASDGYEVVFSWAELFVSPVGDGVYIVYERDGAPLTDDEGRIALIVLSDTRPVRHVKWLKSVSLRAV